jgi:hypothetical protein
MSLSQWNKNHTEFHTEVFNGGPALPLTQDFLVRELFIAAGSGRSGANRFGRVASVSTLPAAKPLTLVVADDGCIFSSGTSKANCEGGIRLIRSLVGE